MSDKFNHKEVESKWQDYWEKNATFKADFTNTKDKYYNLFMFPYPSGEGLHAGHTMSSTGSDIHGKYMRMQGKNVFQPMGYDSFGMHSENFAIKIGESPQTMLARTIKNFEKQFKTFGHGYDWSKSVTTSDVDYYTWTQWVVRELFKAGLAYRKKANVNWCPSCKTVLADEQVMSPIQAGKDPKNADGSPVADSANAQVCERCGTVVEKKELVQWFVRITDYADRLLDGLDKIDWTPKVKLAQKNWIGKSKGLTIAFKVGKQIIPTWTKYWETVFGTTFLVVAPQYAKEHLLELVPKGIRDEVDKYINETLNKSDNDRVEAKHKTGVDTGIRAVNPANGNEVPVFVADYVLASVGTGAVMGVPAHDERDFEFAKKHGLKLLPVVVPERDYIDTNAKSYYKKRSILQRELLKKLVTLANKANKKLMLTGGWAVCAHVGFEFREFEDLDLVIMEEDVVWWKNSLKKIGLKIENLYPGKNEKYYFQATKQDIHIDLGAIRVNEKGNVLWLDETKPRESDPFDEVFEKSELFGQEVCIINRDLLIYLKSRHNGEKRWKEQADFLFLGYKSYEGAGRLINSGEFDNLDARGEGKEEMAKWMIANSMAEWNTDYHLRDWLISRQRYWGPPMPFIFCETCASKGESYFTKNKAKLHPKQEDWDHYGWFIEDKLPVTLPVISDYQPQGEGRGPLASHPEFYEVKCPNCGSSATRETDVSDVFVDSSWYFLRYPSVGSKTADSKPFDPDITKDFLPVDLYFGGAEHSVLHLMYARFVTMALFDLTYIHFEEPFPRFFAHGLMIKDGAKMSKSRGNVVNPDIYIDKFGADTLRLYTTFMGPITGFPDFRDAGIEGMHRFVKRVWRLVNNKLSVDKQADGKTITKANEVVQKVTADIENFRYNTAIASIMEYVNTLYEVIAKNGVSREDVATLALLLAPFAPHIAEEVWQEILKNKASVHHASWPTFDPSRLIKDTVVIPVQVNGKLRGTVEVASSDIEDKVRVIGLAKTNQNITKWLEVGIKQEIYVPGKLLNFVV